MASREKYYLHLDGLDSSELGEILSHVQKLTSVVDIHTGYLPEGSMPPETYKIPGTIGSADKFKDYTTS